jgi:hypothetical protein
MSMMLKAGNCSRMKPNHTPHSGWVAMSRTEAFYSASKPYRIVSRILLGKLTVIQLIKKFIAFYGTWSFITVFIGARHWYLSWVRWIQYTTSHPVSLRSIVILSCHQCLGLPNGLVPQVFRPKFCTHFSWHIRAMCSAYFIFLDLIALIIFGEAKS